MLTVDDLCTRLNVSRMTISRLVDKGELPAYRIGRRLRFDEREVEKYLKGSRVAAKPVVVMLPRRKGRPRSVTDSGYHVGDKVV